LEARFGVWSSDGSFRPFYGHLDAQICFPEVEIAIYVSDLAIFSGTASKGFSL